MVLLSFFISCGPHPASTEQADKSDFKLLASINEAYDNNVTYERENEIEDFITNLILGFNWNYEGKTRAIGFTGRVTREIFAKNSRFSNTSQDFDFSLKNEFSKYDSVSLSDSFTHAEEPRSFEDAFGRTTGRYNYTKNKVDLSYNRDISKQLALIARYSHNADFFSRKDLSDTTMHGAEAELDYALSSATILLAGNDFSHRSFEPGGSATTNTLAFGIKHYFTSQLSVVARSGVEFMESYNGRNFTKPLVAASLIDEVDENTLTSLSFMKRYYTNAYEQDLFDYQQFSAGIRRQLYERLGFSLSGFYGRGKYVSLGIKENLQGVKAGFTYDLRRNISLRTDYSYSRADSNFPGREYAKNTFSLGCSGEF